jgi:hypothetical protein
MRENHEPLQHDGLAAAEVTPTTEHYIHVEGDLGQLAEAARKVSQG